jgi:hypothetical protein
MLACCTAGERPGDEDIFPGMAERWRELADHVESLERERLREQ